MAIRWRKITEIIFICFIQEETCRWREELETPLRHLDGIVSLVWLMIKNNGLFYIKQQVLAPKAFTYYYKKVTSISFSAISSKITKCTVKKFTEFWSAKFNVQRLYKK